MNTQIKKHYQSSSRICAVDGCKDEVGRHGAKDMCSRHYAEHKRSQRKNIQTGVCACGCGMHTTNGSKFKHGHWAKTRNGKRVLRDARYVGARVNHGDGYITINENGSNKLEHVSIAEKAIGKLLPKGSQVHHVDGDRSNNTPSNLVICPNRAYHALLHKRQRALEACGDANFRQCAFCRQWDDPKNLYIPPRYGSAEHRSCGNEYRKTMKRRKDERAYQI